MATLLNGVNEVLKAVQIIAGDSQELTTLTDSSRQAFIDTAVRLWNEAIDELFSATNMPKPTELAENTITLVADDRDYALQSNMNQLYWPFLDETNGDFIFEAKGGYLGIVNSQPQPANFTGQPVTAAIRDTDGQLYLDRIPTAAEAGRVYKYRYDKDLELTAAADNMPFNDVVFRAMVPVVTQLWKRDWEAQFDGDMFLTSLGRAGRYLTRKQARASWRSYA